MSWGGHGTALDKAGSVGTAGAATLEISRRVYRVGGERVLVVVVVWVFMSMCNGTCESA